MKGANPDTSHKVLLFLRDKTLIREGLLRHSPAGVAITVDGGVVQRGWGEVGMPWCTRRLNPTVSNPKAGLAPAGSSPAGH